MRPCSTWLGPAILAPRREHTAAGLRLPSETGFAPGLRTNLWHCRGVVMMQRNAKDQPVAVINCISRVQGIYLHAQFTQWRFNRRGMVATDARLNTRTIGALASTA